MILLTPNSASRSSLAPWNDAGYSIAPTPTMVPCPCIRRGTEWLVPRVPGLVRLIVVAVGMPSEACMFLTTVLAEPRSWVTSPLGAAGVLGLAAREVLPAAGLASGLGAGLASGAAARCAGSERTGAS